MSDQAKQHAPRGRIKARDTDPMTAADPMAGKCTATNRKGNRCTQPHIPGGTVCRYHGGAAPQVKLKAQERLAAYQDRAIDRLFSLVEQTQFPSTAFAAVRDVLDRTMGKPKETVDVTVSGELAVVESRLALARKRAAGALPPASLPPVSE